MCGQLIIDRIFSDGMVLQRNEDNKIFGYDIPRQPIKVTLGYEEYTASADHLGYWEIVLGQKENSGPFEMVVQGSSKKTIKDLYFGDVFLLGGQSNMELPISRVFDLYEEELLDFFNLNQKPIIRQFTMPKEYSFTEDNKGIQSGKWVDLDIKTKLDFSAIGYFFSKHFQSYHQGLNIGLIQAAVGGSPIEAWCNETIIKKHRKDLLSVLACCRRENYITEKIEIEQRNIANWMEHLLEKDAPPIAYSNKLTIPIKYNQVEKLKNISGTVWLQKSIDLTPDIISEMNRELVYIHLGTIVDADEVWVNGVKVGSTAYQYPPRKYLIPSGVLKEGKNNITIRHYIHGGQGEFTTTKPYHIKTKSKNIQISLRGEWYYEIGAITTPQPPMTFFTNKPTALYHSMIHPLKKHKIKGVLWYQGESNTGDEDYGILFQEMILSLRSNFQSKDLPFAFIQLVNYGTPEIAGSPGEWAKLRQEQEKAVGLENVAMVISIDQGESYDIHPLRKKVLGQRLATSMEHLLNGGSESYKGPILTKVVEKDNEWILEFDNVGQGLEVKKPLYFSLYGEIGESNSRIKSKEWTQLKGSLKSKNQISIQKPQNIFDIYKLSYAHLDNPRYVALYNSEGFPARPFVHTF